MLVDSVHMNAIEVAGMKLMEARSRLDACGFSARIALKLQASSPCAKQDLMEILPRCLWIQC